MEQLMVSVESARLGAAITARRRALGLKLAVLARRAGIPWWQLQHIERSALYRRGAERVLRALERAEGRKTASST